MQSRPLFYCSIGIFGLVKNIKDNYSWNFVNSCAGNVLGVYLIHENEYLRKYVWDIFNNGSIENAFKKLEIIVEDVIGRIFGRSTYEE